MSSRTNVTLQKNCNRCRQGTGKCTKRGHYGHLPIVSSDELATEVEPEMVVSQVFVADEADEDYEVVEAVLADEGIAVIDAVVDEVEVDWEEEEGDEGNNEEDLACLQRIRNLGLNPLTHTS